MRKIILTILIIAKYGQGSAQTMPLISEFRTDFGIENLDLRFRPVFYFLSKERMRRELFVGYTIDKTTKIFSYSRYNDYENKFYTGFRFDKKIYFTEKLTLNNQFRYINSPSDKTDKDIGIYIPDLLYKFNNISIGLRGFIINKVDRPSEISITKPFIGPAMIVNEEKFMTMFTFLPDVNQNSRDVLLMALIILKL